MRVLSLHISRCSWVFLSGCLILLAYILAPLAAEAKWFGKEKDKPGIENFEPPAETALQTQCEPIRLKVVNLNDKTPKLLRFAIVPRREYLMSKHRRCKARLMDQQFQYLKHVDIKNPTLKPLPPIVPEETAPPANSPLSPAEPDAPTNPQ